MTTELTQRQITSSVANRIEEMKGEGLLVAPNYSVSNALSSAYYALTNSNSGNLLGKCTQDSIYNALLDMVTQGLSPAKTQCYFIPYGNKVKLTRSYFGTMKVVKQLPEVKDIYAQVIYEGDDVEIKNVEGHKVLVKHDTNWLNQDNPIIGAYCIIEKNDGEKVLTIMTKKEIDKAWAQSKNKSIQNNFPQEMAKRTVINRAAKQFFNTSDDNDLFIDAVNRTTANEYDDERNVKDVTPEQDDSESIDSFLGEPLPEAKDEPKQPKDVTPIEDTPQELTEAPESTEMSEPDNLHEPEQTELFEQLGDLYD
ncbi:recombinase RecT [uncultured Streptococcus sp.]|uniref:recombinase RecT n=1 Tax=uncultured Streptococcus sp. TaxID=83427 RepID=UPI00258BA5FF|nr:RecT family recombinase [uncultured Streptococcus sp.]